MKYRATIKALVILATLSAAPARADYMDVSNQLERDAAFAGHAFKCGRVGYPIDPDAIVGFAKLAIHRASREMGRTSAEYQFYKIVNQEMDDIDSTDKNIFVGAETWGEMERREKAQRVVWDEICSDYQRDKAYIQYFNGEKPKQSHMNYLHSIGKFDKNNFAVPQ
ncbi:hypothetical protein [Asticcacaulis endophyticus]|uniref:Uncharacterized protein n=1 Tax=Asticcacaulis endophyticus TaxID=1395890 RepID=A0A918PT67_9CAUL|nr:hypothetical protein [Asticcacaulis endophyticus]GGZ21911.1 hypothetical protein GCM10011273_03380 [Asticcacaulis endophyticus]